MFKTHSRGIALSQRTTLGRVKRASLVGRVKQTFYRHEAVWIQNSFVCNVPVTRCWRRSNALSPKLHALRRIVSNMDKCASKYAIGKACVLLNSTFVRFIESNRLTIVKPLFIKKAIQNTHSTICYAGEELTACVHFTSHRRQNLAEPCSLLTLTPHIYLG